MILDATTAVTPPPLPQALPHTAGDTQLNKAATEEAVFPSLPARGWYGVHL